MKINVTFNNDKMDDIWYESDVIPRCGEIISIEHDLYHVKFVNHNIKTITPAQLNMGTFENGITHQISYVRVFVKV